MSKNWGGGGGGGGFSPPSPPLPLPTALDYVWTFLHFLTGFVLSPAINMSPAINISPAYTYTYIQAPQPKTHISCSTLLLHCVPSHRYRRMVIKHEDDGVSPGAPEEGNASCSTGVLRDCDGTCLNVNSV